MYGQHATQLVHCFVVAARLEENPCDVPAGYSKRVKLAPTLNPRQGFLCAPMTGKPPGKPVVGSSVAGVQFKGAFVFRFGIGPLPVFPVHHSKQDVRVGKFGIQIQRFSSRAHHFCALQRGRSANKNRAECKMRVSQTDICLAQKSGLSLWPPRKNQYSLRGRPCCRL